MANFFKEYQTLVRQRKQAFEEIQHKERDREKDFLDYIDGLRKGDKVKVMRFYSESGHLFFCARYSENSVLLSETKSDALDGKGNQYSINIIIK